MKKKNTVLILGIMSIFILISVQVFIIIGVWKQKNEMFAIRYFNSSQQASFQIRRSPTDGFDTVRFLLNYYSDKIIDDIAQITDTSLLEERKKDVLYDFTKVLNDEQDFSVLLANYFEENGLEKKFIHSLKINNIELIGNDTITIYQSEWFSNSNPGNRRSRMIPTGKSGSEIMVTWVWLEGDHYRMNFDFFIDFSDKQKVILRETSATLGFSILSILLVGIMFMTTYRNLREEQRLSGLKTDFINNMTHELKTPLSTITVAGKTLEMPQIRSNDTKILETAKLIGKQSVHLNQLINMILEISMWERTQFQLDKKTVDIEDLMKDVVDSFKSGGGNSATIKEKYNFSGIKADLDVVYFTTLLNNLLSNAVKYSDKTPVIEIEGFSTDNNVCIRVSDNGIGINKTDQKHIFDKFYRATSGNIHKFKGLGLGLYYVKKIAEAHGGDVTVSSKPGKGSSFTVTLPGIA